MRTAATTTLEDRERLIRRLESIGAVSTSEKAALNLLPMEVREFGDNEDIIGEGDRSSSCCLILNGFICRYKLVGSGKRQILSFHLRGEIPDLHSLHLPIMDHSMGTLTRARLAFIRHADLQELIRQFPGLGSLFWRETLIDAALFREWMVGLGRRTAHERVAHLMCEMMLRAEAAGLNRDRKYPLPLTQTELADALGLTVVHVNRVLRSLRESSILRVDRSGAQILDWERLRELAEFDPFYLHQHRGSGS